MSFDVHLQGLKRQFKNCFLRHSDLPPSTRKGDACKQHSLINAAVRRPAGCSEVWSASLTGWRGHTFKWITWKPNAVMGSVEILREGHIWSLLCLSYLTLPLKLNLLFCNQNKVLLKSTCFQSGRKIFFAVWTGWDCTCDTTCTGENALITGLAGCLRSGHETEESQFKLTARFNDA